MIESLLCLLGVIVVIVLIILLKKPTWTAMLAGVIASILLYRISMADAADAFLFNLTSWTFWQNIAIFYFMNILHYAMEKRGMMHAAQERLEAVCKNRRVIISLVPIIMGLVPAASAVILAGTIVNNVCREDLSAEDKTFVTTFLRHIPEAFIPTYSSVVLASTLSGIPMSFLILSMLPMGIAMWLAVYLLYLRKIPLTASDSGEKAPPRAYLNLLKALWPLFVVLILVFAGVDVLLSCTFVILGLFLLEQFSLQEILDTCRKAVNGNMLLSMAFILIFRSILDKTELFVLLPDAVNQLALPAVLVFAFIFVVGSFATSVNTVIPIAIPLAFATLDNAGVAVLAFLLTTGHVGMQISPLHYCLSMVCDHFGTSYLNLVKRTLPVIVIMMLVAGGYYLLLSLFGL